MTEQVVSYFRLGRTEHFLDKQKEGALNFANDSGLTVTTLADDLGYMIDNNSEQED